MRHSWVGYPVSTQTEQPRSSARAVAIVWELVLSTLPIAI